MPPRRKGRYEIRQHSRARGLLSIVWIEGSKLPVEGWNLQPADVPLLYEALGAYLGKLSADYRRGRDEAVIELAQMSPEDRAEILSRARHPSGPDLRLMPTPKEAE